MGTQGWQSECELSHLPGQMSIEMSKTQEKPVSTCLEIWKEIRAEVSRRVGPSENHWFQCTNFAVMESVLLIGT